MSEDQKDSAAEPAEYGRQPLAKERTALASDRTLLAWCRTSFGSYGLSVGIGSVVPSLSRGDDQFRSAYAIIGACFALLGVTAAVTGVLHYRRLHAQIPDPVAGGSAKPTHLSLYGSSIAIMGLALAALIVTVWLV